MANMLALVGGIPRIKNNFTPTAVSSNVSLVKNNIYLVDTSAIRTLTLPVGLSGDVVIIKDVTGSAGANNITIARAGSEKIENVVGSYVITVNYTCLTLISDGTNWWKIS